MPIDLHPVTDFGFIEAEDDPGWAFRAGGNSAGSYELQGRHLFCGSTYSVAVAEREIAHDFGDIDAMDTLTGEMVEAIVDKHTPCPVLAGRVKQITIG